MCLQRCNSCPHYLAAVAAALLQRLSTAFVSLYYLLYRAAAETTLADNKQAVMAPIDSRIPEVAPL